MLTDGLYCLLVVEAVVEGKAERHTANKNKILQKSGQKRVALKTRCPRPFSISVVPSFEDDMKKKKKN